MLLFGTNFLLILTDFTIVFWYLAGVIKKCQSIGTSKERTDGY